MSVDYLEFHSSIPITSNSSEMEFRNNISRNHYAVLHYLIDYATKEGIPEAKYSGGTHQKAIDAIIEYLEGKDDLGKAKRLKVIFTNSKSFRTKADYFLDKDIKYWDANQVEKALENVKALLEPST